MIGRLAELRSDDVVLEIGPGLGVLTRFLAERVLLVHAVEIDRSLEPYLRGSANVRTSRSAMRSASTWRARTRRPASSSPICRTTSPRPIVVESLDGLPSVRSWCVMVQREVAERFFADTRTKAYGAVSVLVQLAAERTGFHPVSRTVFRPPPNVDSALVAFRRRPLPEHFPEVKRVVGAAFAHRRKTLPNSLGARRRGLARSGGEALAALGHAADTRAEAIPPRSSPSSRVC